MITVVSGRRTGKTIELIRYCKKLNDEQGHNSVILVTKDSTEAENLYALAQEIGCGDIPYPIPVYELLRTRPTYYRSVIVDNLDRVMQEIISPWELLGYSTTVDEKESE